ncbi:MAG: HAMP domain-containing sensor histidine kinase, partial [Bryobacteraceae bacterium]|nr:HAMP domain-containing sensor histidine kinase [Bryobacteraceae bacterium]
NRCKNVFLATMSHELRTPLNAIIGYSEMVREELARLGQPALAEDTSRIRSAGIHLLQLIHDILDYTNIESGAIEIEREEVALGALLNEAASAIEPLAAANGNRIEIHSTELRIHTDPMRLRQCLTNLLTNAAKFTSDGAITVLAEEIGGTVAIRVRDTGMGIPSAKLPILFQPFVQVDDSPARLRGGAGLGLAICRRLCRLMGGDVTVESRLGEGSTFTLLLPVMMGSHDSLPVDTGSCRLGSGCP